jgi:hypothetical protein
LWYATTLLKPMFHVRMANPFSELTMFRASSILCLSVSFFIAACGASKQSETSSPHTDKPSCAEIGRACQPQDSSQVARECHGFAHSDVATEEQCAAKRTECINACTPDAGH